MPTPLQNITTLNLLKRKFKSQADIELIDLTERVETLETNYTALNASIGDATGFRIIGLISSPSFTSPTPSSDLIRLYIDRFSEVGNISIDTPNSTIPAGFTVDNLVFNGGGLQADVNYDGSAAAGTYPLIIALVAEDGSTSTWTTEIVVA